VDAVKTLGKTLGRWRTPEPACGPRSNVASPGMRLAIFAIALAIGAAAPARPAPPADSARAGPALADSAETAPAPLLIPGRSTPGGTPKKDPRIGAREQVQVGLAHQRRGQPANAISAYRNAVVLDPTVPE